MFDKNLKALRKQHDLTQKQLGEILNVSRGAIAMYESGKRKPDPDLLLAIASKFEISVDLLLGRGENSDEDISVLVSSLSEESTEELRQYIHYLRAKDLKMDNARKLENLRQPK